MIATYPLQLINFFNRFKFDGERLYVFIDHSNIFHSQTTTGWEFDFKKLLDYFIDDNRIDRVYVYLAYKTRDIGQTKWKYAMERAYINSKVKIFFKEIRKKGLKEKGNVDTEMGFDLAYYMNGFDSLLLLSGDGDFFTIVDNFINKFNKRCFIIGVDDHIGGEFHTYRTLINDPSKFDIINYDSIKPHNKPLRDLIKGKLFIPKPIKEYFENQVLSKNKTDLNIIKQWFIDLYDGKNPLDSSLPIAFKNICKGKDPLYKIMKKWKDDVKNELIIFLDSQIKKI